jgi:hypothetical protein
MPLSRRSAGWLAAVPARGTAGPFWLQLARETAYPPMDMADRHSNATLCGALATRAQQEGPGLKCRLYQYHDTVTAHSLEAARRRRLRSRTPGPPPSSSMNSTPAASSARRMARLLAAVIEVWLAASSARRIVRRLTADRPERSSALHPMSARAALI